MMSEAGPPPGKDLLGSADGMIEVEFSHAWDDADAS